MFSYIKGLLVFSTPMHVVIESHGIGYEILIPTSTFSKLPQIETTLLLYTSFIIRENSQTLYGFLTQQEKELFQTLIGVSGVGPKIALSIIGHLSMEDLHRAISQHEITTIAKVPGIGKKIAERLIIEMRDKLAHLFPSNFADFAIPVNEGGQTQLVKDAMNALINLGYNQAVAQKALKKSLQDHPDLNDLGLMITKALQHT